MPARVAPGAPNQLLQAPGAISLAVPCPGHGGRRVFVADEQPKPADLPDRVLEHEVEPVTRLQAAHAPGRWRPEVDLVEAGQATELLEPVLVCGSLSQHRSVPPPSGHP